MGSKHRSSAKGKRTGQRPACTDTHLGRLALAGLADDALNADARLVELRLAEEARDLFAVRADGRLALVLADADAVDGHAQMRLELRLVEG